MLASFTNGTINGFTGWQVRRPKTLSLPGPLGVVWDTSLHNAVYQTCDLKKNLLRTELVTKVYSNLIHLNIFLKVIKLPFPFWDLLSSVQKYELICKTAQIILCVVVNKHEIALSNRVSEGLLVESFLLGNFAGRNRTMLSFLFTVN